MDIRAWIRYLGHADRKILAKLSAPIAYFFIDDKVNHPIWGVRDTKDTSYSNIAFRNSAHNMYNYPAVEYETWTNTEDETLEKLDGLQWRYRKSLDGKYVSFRITWGKPRSRKGKKEIYIGWTMNETNRMRLSIFQFRPF